MGVSIQRGNAYVRGNTDPICAVSRPWFNTAYTRANILGGSGSVQPYNHLCGYNNYLPMLLGADYLNTGGYNMGFPFINYCVPSTIGFLNAGNQALFSIGGCNNDVSSLLGGDNSIFNLCGCGGLGGLYGGGFGGLFSGGILGNMFGGFGGVIQNTLSGLFGRSGSLNGNGNSVSWGRNGVSIASGNGSYIFGSTGKQKNLNFGLFGNYAKSSDGGKAWSLLNGLVSGTKNSGNSSYDFSNLANIGLTSFIDALC